MLKDSSIPASFDRVTSCLFVNGAGKLFRVHCPFQVVCQSMYPPYEVGERLIVTRIGAAADQRVLFQINQQYWPHHPFRLIY
ncbi:hypothetical protein [Spirosoma litoris]